jgi:SAM-dependent methyltransferase
MKKEEIRKAVRDRYGSIARGNVPVAEAESGPTLDSAPTAGCGCGCGPAPSADVTELTYSQTIGYSSTDLRDAPAEANLGLGCGNPTALAGLREGETVLDLGSGAGIDCFLAARKVGPEGRVIGVDMTPDMLSRARENAQKGGYENVEFRLGEIEALPVADSSVDAIISNCVLNLSPERHRVFAEAFRVLKPGGRVMISDLVSTEPVPALLLESTDALVGCLPVQEDEYLGGLREAGLEDVEIVEERSFPTDLLTADPAVQGYLEAHPQERDEVVRFMGSIRSGMIQGRKPA